MTNPFEKSAEWTPLKLDDPIRWSGPYTPKEKAADLALGKISGKFWEAVYKINADVPPIKVVGTGLSSHDALGIKAYTGDWVGNYLEDKHLTYILNRILTLKVLSRKQINLLEQAKLLDPVVWQSSPTDSKSIKSKRLLQLKSMAPWIDDSQIIKIKEIYNSTRRGGRGESSPPALVANNAQLFNPPN